MKKAALRDAVRFLDDFLDYVFGTLDVPSLSYAVVHQDKLLHAQAWGEAVIGRVDATPSTRYRVASNSKMFTAVAIMQLQEQGKLKLDDTVATYLPWLMEHRDNRWKQVTLRQLLSHTAGVIRDSSRSGYWSLQYEFPDRNELQQVVLSDELIFDENTRMKYSNYAFGLLGQVIEVVSRESYRDYVQNHVIHPLGLTRTMMEYNADMSSELAVGYTGLTPLVKRHIPIEPIDTKALGAATGCVSTPSDLALFISKVFSEKTDILTQNSARELRRIHAKVKYGESTEQYYGLGFELGEYSGKNCVGHGGGFPGQVTQTIAIPEDEIAVSVTINTYGLSPTMVAKSILNTLYWYDEHYVEKPTYDLSRFTFRTGHLWGASDNIGYGNTLVCLATKLPIDFSYAEKLERVDDTTIKVTDTSSFLGLGEMVKYVFDSDDNVLYLDDQGTIMLSASERDKRWNKIDQISLAKPDPVDTA